MTDTRAFGIDVSKYDGLLNWDAIDKHVPKVTWIDFRCTISWGYRDPFFMANWKEARVRGYNRAAYHVDYPEQDPIRQIDNLFAHIGNELTSNDRFILDDEVEGGEHDVSMLRHTATIRKMADLIFARTLTKPRLYSRAEFLTRKVDMTQLPDLDLHLAHYLTKPLLAAYANEHPGPPALPKDATKWLVHQTGDKLRPFCAGTTKQYQDYDRWNGDESAVNKYFGRSENVIPLPPIVDPHLAQMDSAYNELLDVQAGIAAARAEYAVDMAAADQMYEIDKAEAKAKLDEKLDRQNGEIEYIKSILKGQ